MGILASDTFSRANQSGWGTSSGGQVWSSVRGAGSYSITSNEGDNSSNAPNFSVARIGSGTATSTEVLVRINPADTTSDIGAVARYIDANNFYYGVFASGKVVIGKDVSGAFSTLNSASFSYANGTFYWLRFNLVGTALKLRAWQDGTSEPSTWTITTTDSSLSSGGYGLGSDASGTTQFDSLTVTDASATTNTRTVLASAALLQTSKRTIPASAALVVAATRTITPITVALKTTSTRTVGATAALKTTNARTVAATVALKETLTRTITSVSVALKTTNTRTVPDTVALKTTNARTISATTSLVFTRSVPATAALKTTNKRTVPVTVSLSGVIPPQNAMVIVRSGNVSVHVKSGNTSVIIR